MQNPDAAKFVLETLTNEAAARSGTSKENCAAVLAAMTELGESGFAGSFDAHVAQISQKAGLSAADTVVILEAVNQVVGMLRGNSGELDPAYLDDSQDDEEQAPDSMEAAAASVLQRHADAIAASLQQPVETCFSILSAFEERCDASPDTTFEQDVAAIAESTGHSANLVEQVLDALDNLLDSH